MQLRKKRLKQEANLTSLPLELKVKLFRMMTEYNDALSLTQVNQDWRKIGENPRNWMITEMTFSSVPWKRVEGVLSSISEKTRITRSTPTYHIPFERTRHLTTVKFEKMTYDGYGERTLRILAEHGHITLVTLFRCELFNISLRTEDILERNKIKQFVIDRCTIRLPRAKFRLIGGVEISEDKGHVPDEGLLDLGFIMKHKTPAVEGCWSNGSKWRYILQLEDQKHLKLWRQTKKLFYNISDNVL